MMYPLVLELAATDAPIRVPITVTCRVLGFSTQAFYQWRANPVCARDLDDAYWCRRRNRSRRLTSRITSKAHHRVGLSLGALHLSAGFRRRCGNLFGRYVATR